MRVLAAVNRKDTAFVRDVCVDVRLSAATVIRILETLSACGYVEKLPQRKGYRVTAKVTNLSTGFQREPLVAAVARPYADELTRKFLWPISVCTLDVDAMVVQYSTIPMSPLAHVHSTLNKRLSLVARAHGRAYIAFCSPGERNLLMHLVAKSSDPEKAAVSDTRELRHLIKETRSRGYAVRARQFDPQTTSMAVPVLLGKGSVAATLGMTYFPRAVRARQLAHYTEALREDAKAISLDLRRALGWSA